MRRIILDTNFLMIPGSLGVDIFSEIERVASFTHEVCLVRKTMDELAEIASRGKGKESRSAKLALELVKAKKIVIIEGKNNLNADQFLVEEARPGQDIVATQDRELKRRLKELGVSLLVLRKKKFLNMTET